jgi:hypothetical protein
MDEGSKYMRLRGVGLGCPSMFGWNLILWTGDGCGKPSAISADSTSKRKDAVGLWAPVVELSEEFAREKCG